MLLANTLVREGVAVYINNVEITRYNLGFELHPNPRNKTEPYAATRASYMFRFPRYTAASFSHLYLQQDVNIIAVEIHRHLLSDNVLHFALELLLLYTSEYQYSSSFPYVSSSVSVCMPGSAHA